MDDDSQLTQADFDAMAQSDNVNFDNYADNISLQTARMVAEPASQRNRSNILNAVDATGKNIYDPEFAAALKITQGLDPTKSITGGISRLTVPSYLRPQIEGEIDGKKVMFNSRGEQVLQQYLPGIVKQGMDMGIMGLARKGFDIFTEYLVVIQLALNKLKERIHNETYRKF